MKYLTSINLVQNELQNAVIQVLATDPANGKIGQIYYNSANKALMQYDGEAWRQVGVVYQQGSTTGAVITGLDATGKVTTTNVTGLTLTGYTPVEGGYVTEGMTLEQAMQAMDTAIKNAVAGGGEVNQNAWSKISIPAQSTAATAVAGQAEDVVLSSDAKVDTFVLKTGNKWVDINGSGKTVNIGHSLSGAAAGTYGDATHSPKLTVDEAGHITSVEQIEITQPDVPDYTIVKLTTATEGYIATYQLQKDGVQVGANIDIPKDYLVKSADIKVSTGDGDPSGLPAGTKYIDFVINTKVGVGEESHIYLSVQELVDTYKAGNGIEISTTNEISAKVVAANGLSVGTDGIAMALASATANGAMSKEQFTKLGEIADNATANTITLNGAVTADPTFYAPTTVGTAGQHLVSSGTGAPTWQNMPTILKKYTEYNEALTASGGIFTWTITKATHGITTPAIVQLFEEVTGEMVIADVTVDNNSVVTIKIVGSGTLAKATYRVVIIG